MDSLTIEEKRKDKINCKKREMYALNPEKYKNKITESLKLTKHNWYLKNKEKIINKQSFPNICNCGGKFQNVNKKQHLKSKKHQKYLNTNGDQSSL